MEFLVLAQIVFYCAGAIFPFILKNDGVINRWTHVSAIAGGLTGVLYSLIVLVTGRGFSFEAPALPFVGNWSFAVDPLSAFFVFVISFLSVPATIFAIRYIQEFQDKKRIAFLGFFYNLFILAMVLVVCARNAFYFLVFWEMMSLASYFLVVAVFWTALVGFGTKAGIIPLHIWLPEAHPQAPSHVSALMSGVMIKTAIYALIRFLFSFLGDIPLWWGSTVLFIAIVSAVLGVLYALMEHDLKRLLAFHSIENIGIILLGLGMSLIFVSTGNLTYASFALVAALFHTLNHASFKGLLFFGSGSCVV